MIGSADKARANVYRQLATLERSGVPILKGLARLAGRGGTASYMLQPVLQQVQAGANLGDAFAMSNVFTGLEQKVVEAGERAGTLPAAFEELAELYDDRCRMKREIVASLAYPLFLLHLAILLPSLPTLITKGVGGYLQVTLVPILIGYAVCGVLYAGFRFGRNASPLAVDRILISIPVLGSIVKKLAVATCLRAVNALYMSGVPVTEGVQTAAEVAPNAIVGQAFSRVARNLRDGLEIGEAFEMEYGLLPEIVIDMVHTGAATGQLDEMLSRAVEQMDHEAKGARRALMVVMGVLAFLLAAAVVAYQVISFWTSYMDRINNI